MGAITSLFDRNTRNRTSSTAYATLPDDQSVDEDKTDKTNSHTDGCQPDTDGKNQQELGSRSPQRKSDEGANGAVGLGLTAESSYQPVKKEQISASPSVSSAHSTKRTTSPPAQYVLCEGFADRVVEYTPVPSDNARSAEINTTAASISQLYKPIQARQHAIRDSLTNFKNCLGVSEDKDMAACFGRLRILIGDRAELELLSSGNEPLKLKFKSGAWSSADNSGRNAVTYFNEVLNHCQKYKGERELRIADIRFKLDDLHLMPLTQEGQALFETLNIIPDYFDELSKDIDQLHLQITEHQDYLH